MLTCKTSITLLCKPLIERTLTSALPTPLIAIITGYAAFIQVTQNETTFQFFFLKANFKGDRESKMGSKTHFSKYLSLCAYELNSHSDPKNARIQ